MVEFPVNTTRFDPYKNSKFRVKWDGVFIPGVIKVGPLQRQTGVVLNREGGDPSVERHSLGTTSFASVALVRGRTQDLSFEQWANKVFEFGATPGQEASLKDFRKDVRIELLNEAGQVVLAYTLFRCWPSFYRALSELDANGGGVALESMVLECEGWQRDTAVVEPVEPKVG